MPLILYALARFDHPLTNPGSGVFGEPARWLPVGSHQVLVSECNVDIALPGRSNLDDFQALIQQLAEVGDVLPMSFGMLANNENAIVSGLLPRLAQLKMRLEAIANRVEYAVRLMWRGDNLYAYLAEQSEELGQLRDFYGAGGRALSLSERIHLGQTLDRLLQQHRAKFHQRLRESLSGVIKEYQALDIDDDRCWANLAIIINREYKSRLLDATSHFADATSVVKLELSAPYPPYRFVNLSLG